MTKFITSIGLCNLIASERPNVKHKNIMQSIRRVFTVEDLTLASFAAEAPLAAATNIYPNETLIVECNLPNDNSKVIQVYYTDGNNGHNQPMYLLTNIQALNLTSRYSMTIQQRLLEKIENDIQCVEIK